MILREFRNSYIPTPCFRQMNCCTAARKTMAFFPTTDTAFWPVHKIRSSLTSVNVDCCGTSLSEKHNEASFGWLRFHQRMARLQFLARYYVVAMYYISDKAFIPGASSTGNFICLELHRNIYTFVCTFSTAQRCDN